MTNVQALAIGGLICLGLVLHGALSPAPTAAASATDPWRERPSDSSAEAERIRTEGATKRALIERCRPTVLTLGDRVLLYTSEWDERNGNLRIANRYHEYREGKLVQVPVEASPK